MIRSSHHHSSDEFAMLLDGKLNDAMTLQMEQHLAECPRCQATMEEVAGNRQWWESTETALRISTSSQPKLVQANPLRSDSDLEQQANSSWLHRIAIDGCLGPFQLESTIGHGGTGVVVQATDKQLNRRVAVKVLYPHLASQGAARQRFAREAQAAAAVVHPSVVPIHAVNAEHDPPYLVMTYVPGGSLQQRLDKHGALELVELLRIALQIAEGLAAAHAQGLVHRDVKPANILLEEGTDRVLLSDFGLARALDDATLTASGFVAGTPPYMSPEQARGEAVDCRSDLFSVGSLLFAMATGRPPFVGSSALSILQQLNDNQAPSLRSINEQMPIWLERLIALCHVKSPSQRIASADHLADLLRQCLAHVQRPTVFPLPRELDNSRPWIPMLTGGLAAGLALGLVVGWFVWSGNRKPGEDGWLKNPSSDTTSRSSGLTDGTPGGLSQQPSLLANPNTRPGNTGVTVEGGAIAYPRVHVSSSDASAEEIDRRLYDLRFRLQQLLESSKEIMK